MVLVYLDTHPLFLLTGCHCVGVTPVLTVCWSSPQLTSLSCDVEHPDMNNVKTTAIISLALLTVVTANRLVRRLFPLLFWMFVEREDS